LVEAMVGEKIQVTLVCAILGVSRSGFYAWGRRPSSARAEENEKLIAAMKRIHDESRGTYGLPRIHEQLKQDGKVVSKGRVSRLMKKTGISGLIKKRFRVKTTDSEHELPIADRIFKTEEPETHPEKPNQVWASDISYVPTDEGFVFLGTYLDLFTRKVVGFAVEDHMRTELLLQALEMALGRQSLTAGELLGHSDRGSQYASDVYREKLKKCGITASMSRKGNCYDNAFAESFFATLKKELIYRNHYRTKAEAKKAIFEYIEVWYNRRRLHSSLGFKSPVQFEESLAA
jgi:transposase InsO family protein